MRATIDGRLGGDLRRVLVGVGQSNLGCLDSGGGGCSVVACDLAVGLRVSS